jgi:predicted ATP-grasp superfamily ATP-dependent carboligase
MKSYKNIAIVLGGGINGLGVTRNLGRNGVHVYLVTDKVDEAMYSRYCEKHFVFPHVQEKKVALRSLLNRIEKGLTDQGVVIPTTDLFSLHLSEISEDLEGNFCILLPKAETVRTLVDKKCFYNSVFNHKLPHPLTLFPESVKDAMEISRNIKYPAFVKPSISQVFSRRFGKKGFIAYSAAELIQYYRLASKYGIDVMLQEVIPGSADRIYGIAGYFDKNHRPKALFGYHRLESWPPLFGTSSLIESIALSEIAEIKETVNSYLLQIGYYGIMEAEFKKDPRDGIFKFLEINARSWWQNSLPTKCGINIIFIAYLDSIGKSIKYSEEYGAGVKWINFLDDLRSLTLTGHMRLGDWSLHLKGVRDCAFFSIDDAVPWIAYNMLIPSKLLKSLHKRSEDNTHNTKPV